MSFDATPSDSSTHFHYPTAPTFSRSTTADTAASVETAITPFDEDDDKASLHPLKTDSVTITGHLYSPWRPGPVSVCATRGPGDTVLLSENAAGLNVTEDSYWRACG